MTLEDIERYGKRIVSSQIAMAILERTAKRKLDRNIIIQKCRAGKLSPMGTYGNSLYFWRKDIEDAHVNKREKPGKASVSQ